MRPRALFACILLCGSVYAEAPKLAPLNEWMSQNPSWSDRPGEATYLFSRCAAALTVMGAYIAANARPNSDDSNTGQILNNRAGDFLKLSIELGQTTGATADFLYNRANALSQVYTQDVLNNKLLHNDAFVGSFKQDIDFCTGIYPHLFR